MQKFEVRTTSEKSEKTRAKSKKNLLKMRCYVTPCGQTDLGSSQKKCLLPSRVLLNVGNDPNFPKKKIYFLALFREKFRFPAKTFLA